MVWKDEKLQRFWGSQKNSTIFTHTQKSVAREDCLKEGGVAGGGEGLAAWQA